MLSVQLDTSFFFKLKYTFDVLDFNKVTMIIQMWVVFFFFCIDMYFHFSWVN